ncbi:MAG: methyltransferase domain-containing protein [Alphaproteobacteria bacterium]|nr:MAG: methyltransferase domain-containing protein [Alphaproteobacteria bacterium]
MNEGGPTQTGDRPARKALLLRLKAWWEGYDPDEYARWVAAREAALRAANGKDSPEEVEEPPVVEDEQPEEPEPSATPEIPIDPWDDRRAEIAQYIWGEGYCGPGGPEHVISMSKLLALSPKQSLLEIGSNLGGPARTLAQKFGVWVTGYESSPNLVELANEISHRKGLLKKAEVFHYDPDTITDFDRRYDRALAKESLYQVENKAHLLEVVEAHMKPGALFLITDYVLGDESWVATDEYREWRDRESERRRPRLTTAEDIVSMLKKVRFNIRVNEDVSDHYIELINESWKGADRVAEKVATQDDGEALVQTLLREAEFWSTRVRLLRDGKLRVRRILATKKSEKPAMLSDW